MVEGTSKGKDQKDMSKKEMVDKSQIDNELVDIEPDTESVPPSPVTGQTADESQVKPGQ